MTGLFSRVGRCTSVAWVAALVVSWVLVGPASANSAPLPVSFVGAGQTLPQEEIRAAIAKELGRETLAGDERGNAEWEHRERVQVAVDERGELWVSYFGPRGLVDRHLPMPTHRDEIPTVVSLSVGNLARQEAFELLRDIERRRRAEQAEGAAAGDVKPVAKPTAPAPQRPLSPQQAVPRRTNARFEPREGPKSSWGHYLVGDVAYVPGTRRNCAPGGRDACYDWNYRPIAFDIEGSGRVGGIVPAHARYVMTYSRALEPGLWGSARIGFAFTGAHAQDEAAARDANVSEFVPWLLEARVQHFLYRDELTGVFRPFAHLAAGYSEESPELAIQAPQEVLTDESGGTWVVVRYAIGPFFAGGGLGGSFSLFEPIRVELELSGLVTFPRTGWLVRPSLGASYDF